MKKAFVGKAIWLASLVLFLRLGLELAGPGLLLKGKEPATEPFALLVGTCVDENGFSLPGARVIIELAAQGQHKKWERLSSPRGEFAVRLPAGKNNFKVTATKKGFQSSEKTVSFEGEERLDLILKLHRESQNK